MSMHTDDLADDARAVHTIRVSTRAAVVDGELAIPVGARGLVLFALGSGTSRFGRRNRWLATELQWGRFATLLVDLLTAEEAERDALSGRYRFDAELLARRVTDTLDWLTAQHQTRALPIGIFATGTAAAAALSAAAHRPHVVRAIVSQSGRPDLVERSLPGVTAPTLLIVGAKDPDVLVLNGTARRRLTCDSAIEVVPDASHSFSEPGALEQVATAAREWFVKYLHASALKR